MPPPVSLRAVIAFASRAYAAPGQLPLFAASQHWLSFFLAPTTFAGFASTALALSAAIVFFSSRGGGWGACWSQAFEPALFLFFVERSLVATQMRGQWFCTLLARAQQFGR